MIKTGCCHHRQTAQLVFQHSRLPIHQRGHQSDPRLPVIIKKQIDICDTIHVHHKRLRQPRLRRKQRTGTTDNQQLRDTGGQLNSLMLDQWNTHDSTIMLLARLKPTRRHGLPPLRQRRTNHAITSSRPRHASRDPRTAGSNLACFTSSRSTYCRAVDRNPVSLFTTAEAACCRYETNDRELT